MTDGPGYVEIATAFTVVVHTDGTASVWPGDPPPGTQRLREATLVDIEAYGSQVAREAGRLMQTRELLPPPVLEEPAVARAFRKRKK